MIYVNISVVNKRLLKKLYFTYKGRGSFHSCPYKTDVFKIQFYAIGENSLLANDQFKKILLKHENLREHFSTFEQTQRFGTSNRN